MLYNILTPQSLTRSFVQALRGGQFTLKNKKMKIARMELDINQEELARRVGVTRQTIGMIESGNYNPTLNLCIAICDALGKTLDELFWTNKDERENNENGER